MVELEQPRENDTEEVVERQTWRGRFDFAVSCLGYAVGLSNIWRFPFLCYKNGGGAFLIPYCTLLMFACIPLIVLEFALGQYSSSNMVTVWRALPIMRGLSYCQFLSYSVTLGYYNIIIAYSIYYCFASFTRNLPWVGCDHSWNTPYCSEHLGACLGDGGIIIANGSCANLTMLTEDELGEYNVIVHNETFVDLGNYTDPLKMKRRLPSEEYWTNQFLNESSSISDVGGVVWQVTLSNLFVWVIMFVIIAKGIKTSGKVVYFTALFPYVMLTALLIRAVTLDGYYEGIIFYLKPNWTKIASPLPWKDAAQQVFFSAGAGGGSLLTLSSFNNFHNTFINDSMLVAVGNSLTSFYGGFAVFAILGYMSKQSGTPIKDVVRGGFGLVFVVCPAALAEFPGAPAWSALFFFMLFLLALDSQFVCLEAVITVFLDHFPKLRKWRVIVVAVSCIVCFLTSFSYMTNAGPYWVALIDSYASGWISIISGLALPLSFGWVYGIRRLKNDIRAMLGSKLVDHWSFMYWQLSWLFFTPAILLIILVYNITNWSKPEYNGPFPAWCHVIGWLFIVGTMIFIPAVWIYDLVRTRGTFRQRLRVLTRPVDDWGPANLEDRIEAYWVHVQNGTTMGGSFHPEKAPLPYSKDPLGTELHPLNAAARVNDES
ncbi:sodium- and chloride-dependent neutral and basic amino acid transporter B(0+)-like [Diadema antillarum]|uniref:sodium- and chloride-dependent neutral and basic amino acid transporter B(0+)-like n=1 Tax=Diadema antillarum TaxID=105358 RepID=UPI003A89448B